MKFLKIIAIVLFIVGIGALALAGYGYATFGANAIERTEASKKALEEAIAEGETADRVEQLSGYLEFNIKLEARAKQQITMIAAGGIVSIIIAVVLWFVSRKKGAIQRRWRLRRGRLQRPPDHPLARKTWPAAFYGQWLWTFMGAQGQTEKRCRERPQRTIGFTGRSPQPEPSLSISSIPCGWPPRKMSHRKLLCGQSSRKERSLMIGHKQVLQLIIAVILVISFLVGCGTPTTGKIEGMVYRSDMMEPIPGATVKLSLSGSDVAETTTDEQGKYSFAKLKPDTAYLLSVVAIFKNKNASPCADILLAKNRDGLLMGVKDKALPEK